MQNHKVTVSRGVFNVREGGNKLGFPVVMLHGWPTSSYCWERVGAHLNPDFRIIAPDLRGLGNSERTHNPDAYRKVELAKDVIQIIEALELDEFFLVGHSVGGIVAQEVALIAPERVKKLVLLNSVIINNLAANLRAQKVLMNQSDTPVWFQLFQQEPALIEPMMKNNEDLWLSHFFGYTGDNNGIASTVVNEYIRCYMIRDTCATGAHYFQTLADDGRRWASLANIRFTTPTLYLYGNLDPVIIPRYLNDIGKCFESIKVKTIHAAHYLADEKPAEIAALIDAFFQTSTQCHRGLLLEDALIGH